jgi:hypothetical protein
MAVAPRNGCSAADSGKLGMALSVGFGDPVCMMAYLCSAEATVNASAEDRNSSNFVDNSVNKRWVVR